ESNRAKKRNLAAKRIAEACARRDPAIVASGPVVTSQPSDQPAKIVTQPPIGVAPAPKPTTFASIAKASGVAAHTNNSLPLVGRKQTPPPATDNFKVKSEAIKSKTFPLFVEVNKTPTNASVQQV